MNGRFTPPKPAVQMVTVEDAQRIEAKAYRVGIAHGAVEGRAQAYAFAVLLALVGCSW